MSSSCGPMSSAAEASLPLVPGGLGGSPGLLGFRQHRRRPEQRSLGTLMGRHLRKRDEKNVGFPVFLTQIPSKSGEKGPVRQIWGWAAGALVVAGNKMARVRVAFASSGSQNNKASPSMIIKHLGAIIRGYQSCRFVGLWMVAKSWTTKRMVETCWNPWNNGNTHLSTGSGFCTHPQYNAILTATSAYLLAITIGMFVVESI